MMKVTARRDIRVPHPLPFATPGSRGAAFTDT